MGKHLPSIALAVGLAVALTLGLTQGKISITQYLTGERNHVGIFSSQKIIGAELCKADSMRLGKVSKTSERGWVY